MEELCKGLCPLALRLADAKIEQSQNLRFAKKKKKEYPNARVFFYKIYYGRALSNTKELWNLHGQGDGEIAFLYSPLTLFV